METLNNLTTSKTNEDLLSHLDEKRRTLMHLILSLVWVTLGVYTAIYYVLGYTPLTYIVGFGFLILSPATLYLSNLGYHKAASTLFIASCNLYIFFSQISFVGDSHAEYYYIPALILPMVLYGRRATLLTIIGILLPIILWAAEPFAVSYLLPDPWRIHNAPIHLLSQINFLGAGTILVVFLFLFIRTLVNLRDQFIAKKDHESKIVLELYDKLEKTQKVAKLGRWVYDPKNDVFSVSSIVPKILDLTDEQSYSMTDLQNKIDISDETTWQCAFSDLVEKGTPFDILVRLSGDISNNSPANYVRVIGKSEITTSGIRYFGTLQDTTQDIEQKKSEHLLSTILDHVPLGLCTRDYSDGSGRFLTWNKEAEKIWGLPAKTVFTQAPSITDTQTKVLTPGESLPYPNIEANETPIECQLNIAEETKVLRIWRTPILNNKLKENLILNIVQDITQEKKLSQQVEQAKRVVLSAAQIRTHFFSYKSNETRLFASILREFINVFGANEGYFAETSLTEDGSVLLRHPIFSRRDENLPANINENHLETLTKLSQMAIDSGEVVQLSPFSRDESTVGLPSLCDSNKEFIGIPILRGGECLAFLGLIHSHVGREVEVEYYSPVIEACADIVSLLNSQRQIRDSEAKAQKSLKLATLGQLAAGVGHEINNPLAIISGHMEAIRKSSIHDNKIQASINKQARALERVKAIVNGLKTYSRSNEDTSESFDVHSLIEDTLDLTRILYEKTGIDFEVDLSAEKSNIEGYYGKLQQVFINMFSNAKHAMENNKRSKKIKVGTYNKSSKLIIEVSDTGAGIKAEHIDKIFEPYFTTKEQGVGTGLGLDICKRIIEENGGEIDLRSEVNRGTTFSLVFRYSLVRSDKSEKVIQHPQLEPVQGQVLLVDDEEDIRELLAEDLSDMGLNVTEAANGEEALMLIQRQPFDLIITDIQMPVMDGYELIKRCRHVNWKNIPILVLTGGHIGQTDHQKRRQLEKWATGTIGKPYDSFKIQQMISEILNHKNKKEVA